MSVINAHPLLLGDDGYQISRSVRLRSSATSYFNRTPAGAGNRQKWTWSAWGKMGDVSGSTMNLFGSGDGTTSNYTRLQFVTSNIQFINVIGGASAGSWQSTSVYRDPSAWYHIVVAYDSTNATAANRMILYVNGVAVTGSFSTAVTLNANTWINSTNAHYTGRESYSASAYLDGYLTEVNFIDGQALTPSSFGETDAVTGVWKPKKYAGTYGTNGFYLPFSDNSSTPSLGYDQKSASAKHVTMVDSGTGGQATVFAGAGAFVNSTISTSDASVPASTGNYLNVTFANVPVTSTLNIYTDSAFGWGTSSGMYVNGTLLTAGNVTVTSVSGMYQWAVNIGALGLTKLTSLRTNAAVGGRERLYGVQVDGATLLPTANDWFPNNISLTAGVTYDSMIDTPTAYADGGNGRGNYCVLNGANNGYGTTTLSQGNLYAVASAPVATEGMAVGTIGMSTGKWYWEVNVVSVNTTYSYGCSIGIGNLSTTTGVGMPNASYAYNAKTGNKLSSTGSFVDAAYGASYTANDVIGVAFDADAGTLTFYKNNVSQGTAFTGIASSTWFARFGSNDGCTLAFNFGQRPFAYTPPTGFKALNTQNLPDATIKAGNKYFNATLYASTNANLSITNGAGMQPDLVWFKRRDSVASHVLVDSVRGASKVLQSDLTGAEQTSSAGTGVSSFDAGGFSLGTDTSTSGQTNPTSGSMVAWQWKKGSSQGFDIVTYTGDGSSNRAVSHSLGAAPAFIIVKNRTTTATNWLTWHKSFGANEYIALNQTSAKNYAGALTSTFGGTSGFFPNSTSFYIGSDNSVNQSTNALVAYLFAEVAGFSKFGSYTGNGSADGPFVYCGFRPRFVMVKNASTGATDWITLDSARDTYNVTTKYLKPNLSDAEGSGSGMQFLSNGFKWQNDTGTSVNQSGATFIFAAFAENPFKNALAR
jgi:hypothetical protein